MRTTRPAATNQYKHGAARAPQARKLACAVAAAMLFGAGGAYAELPTGSTVVRGPVNFVPTSSNSMLIQAGDKSVINWNSFSIGNGNLVQFSQGSSSATVLNRVTGTSGSNIAGNLIADGRVFLVNPNGVFFSSTAVVNVGGLIASTLDIADNDFVNGNYVFAKAVGSPLGQVVNNGSITASSGGSVALFGEQVTNGATGVITAPGGRIGMGVGERISVSFDSNQLLSFTVDQKALNSAAYATNNGQLLADGGKVQMTAAVANSLSSAVVNQNGVIRAAGVSNKNGEVYLSADGGDIEIAGSIDVGAASGASPASLNINSANGNLRILDGASLNASGAAASTVSLVSSGTVSVRGTVGAASTEESASIAVQGNGVALNNANLNAAGFTSSFISVNSGTGAVTQSASGSLRAVTTATASQAAGFGGYAMGGVMIGGDGSHNLAGSIEAGAAGPDSSALVSLTSSTGSISAGTITARAQNGGIGGTVQLSAPGSITTTGVITNYSDTGPASTSISAGGDVNIGGNISTQSQSGTGSATLTTVNSSTGNINMAASTQIAVTDLSGAGVPSNGAGLSLNAAQGHVNAGDLSVTSTSGATQVAVNGNGGVAMNGNVSASGQTALVDVGSASGSVSQASGKTVLASSPNIGGTQISVNAPSLNLAGSQVRQEPTVPGATQVAASSAATVAAPQLQLDPGQALLTRLLAVSRSTPSNPLASNTLIVMPSWNIVGANSYTGGSIDAALFEEDGPDSLNPTSDVQVDAAPINAAMKK